MAMLGRVFVQYLAVVLVSGCYFVSLLPHCQSYSSPTGSPLSRRDVLLRGLALASSSTAAVIPGRAVAKSSSGGMRLPDDDATRPTSTPYTKLPTGTKFIELSPGTGEVVKEGSMVTCEWTLRRQNGYFVDGSEQNFDTFVHRVGDGKAIAGFDDGLIGMREGGSRRIVIPPNRGYVDGAGNGKPGPTPTGYGPQRQVNIRKDVEFFIIETRVTRVRAPKKQ